MVSPFFGDGSRWVEIVSFGLLVSINLVPFLLLVLVQSTVFG